MTATITSIAHYLPPDVLDNKYFEEILDTTDEWIMSRTGIKTRHIIKDGATSDLIVPAALECLKKRGITPADVDCIIVCTVTPDHSFPNTASIVQRKIDAKNAWGFDMNAACSSFLFGLTTAASMVESGVCKNVLLCGADKMTSIVDYTDRSHAVLFGDAGAVCLVEKSEDPAYGVLDQILHIDGIGQPHLHMKAGGSARPASAETVANREHYIYQEGQPVFKAAVTAMADVSVEIMKRNNLSADDVAYLVPHQANLRIISSTGDRMGLPKEKVMINIEKYGNTTSATIPLCLSELCEQGKIKKGDNLVLASFGAGFTWGSILLKWSLND